MFWSNFSHGENREILTGAGFELLETKSTGSGYEDATQEFSEDHPLVLARKQ